LKHYVALKSFDRLPPFIDLAAHAFDKSVRKKDYLGFDYSFGSYRGQKKRLSFLFLRWPKFLDNPGCPRYTSTTVVSIVFSPFHRIPHSKIILRCAERAGYLYLAQVLIGSPAGDLIPTPAKIDHRTFYRLVHYFAKRTGGMIYENERAQPLTPKEYYKEHKKIIDHPFHLKLTSLDLKRFASNTF
jgi:hypothetical protein